ncbi:hydrolase, alpha/beta domain protein [Onchocerca flexuosa]|uniref:sn-1-specific diacylglycerol lipase ABHD11 n=2 Tax=Onchocerca flexuosa TaxID=387005 RepID=A0A238C5P1_9BILA|nr:hydrolase, alpha/beta domain protein [Onchocerca flexuosa]
MCDLLRQYKWRQLIQVYRLSSRPIPLTFDKFGSEIETECRVSPVVILHGLFGQKTNWQLIANNLCRLLRTVIFTLDLRNHGNSPWHPTMTYAEMANDVQYFIDEIIPQEIGEFSKVHLLGHSMGGKIAMRVALTKDSDVRLKSLIVEDIAPKGYNSLIFFSKIVEAMKSVNLSCSRAEIERELAVTITDKTTRLFLLMNLSWTNQNMYSWRLNLDSIGCHIREICGNSGIENNGMYDGKCLFVSGGVSKYVMPSDHSLILKHFPNTQFSVIPNAGHWVHAEKPYEFMDSVAKFIRSIEELEGKERSEKCKDI